VSYFFSLLSRVLATVAILFKISLVGYTQNFSPLDVVAKVETQAITQHDIISRLALQAAFEGREDLGPEAQKATLETLIDEALAQQFAASRDILPSDAEVSAAVSNLASSNNLSLAELTRALSERNTDIYALQSNFAAQLTWNTLISNVFGNRADVSEEQLEAEWSRISAGRGQTEWFLLEINLNEADLEDAQAVANQLSEGANPYDLARRLSSSPSAADAGRRGWVWEEDLTTRVTTVLQNTPEGTPTVPIDNNNGFTIYIPLATRKVGTSGSQDLISLYRLFISLENQGQSPRDTQKLLTLDQALRGVSNCSEFEEVMVAYGEGPSGKTGELPRDTLTPLVQQVVADLDINTFSNLVPDEGGASIFMNCGQRKLDIPLTRDEVRLRLLDEKAKALRKDLTLTLRRQAFIEYK